MGDCGACGGTRTENRGESLVWKLFDMRLDKALGSTTGIKAACIDGEYLASVIVMV